MIRRTLDRTRPLPCRLALGAAIPVLAVLGACQEPLLSDRDERTQFDRYDRVRSDFAPQYIEDEYGRREPNLRGRLAPKR